MNDCTYLSASTESNRTHGDVKHHYHTDVGSNSRFNSLQATVIIGKWPYFEEEVKARWEIGARYSELLNDHFIAPIVAEENTHVYAQYTVRVEEGRRDKIVKGIREADIPVGIYYPKCFHEQPVFEYLGYSYDDFPESEKASKEILSLPIHPFFEEKDLEKVVSNLIGILDQQRS